MSKSLQQTLGPMEVNRVDGPQERPAHAVNRVDHLTELPLKMAKAKVGECVREAIGPRQLKEFGDKGLMGNVISGEKAPDYMARIYQDPAARRRLAFALLKGDPSVKVRTVIEIEEEAS